MLAQKEKAASDPERWIYLKPVIRSLLKFFWRRGILSFYKYF